MFWRLAVKPGRPVAMGVASRGHARGRPAGQSGRGGGVLPAPGAAAAAAPGGRGGPAAAALAALAEFDYRKKAGRREYVRVTLRTDGAVTRAQKFPREGAGLLSSLTESDGFAELPEDVTQVAPGDAILVLPFAGML